MGDINPIRNLNNLNRGTCKQWIWRKKENYSKSCDYLQKINYCIQDLNCEIEDLKNPSMKEVVFIIVLIDWIKEAVDELPKLLIKGLDKDFIYSKQSEIDVANKYFKAIRSFVVAHPLSTDRHQDFGFDGDKICVDIRCDLSTISKVITRIEDWYLLNFDGLIPNNKNDSSDFVLMIYSEQKDNMQFFKYIGASFSDLYHVAELQIEKLYALDKYLGKLRKKDWINK